MLYKYMCEQMNAICHLKSTLHSTKRNALYKNQSFLISSHHKKLFETLLDHAGIRCFI